jgi:hypothetical protein
MSTVQIIGIVIALASLVAIGLAVPPIDRYIRELRDRWQQRAEAPATTEEEGSFFDSAPRTDRQWLAEQEAPSTVERGATVAMPDPSEADTAPPEGLPGRDAER